MVRFTWDRRKAASNLTKHGVSFHEATTVFEDEYGRLIRDPDHSQEEDRFVLLGRSTIQRLLLVCHCYRAEEEEIRIISARKATSWEKKIYEEYRP